MFTSLDKALAAIIMGILFVLNSLFHISIPNFMTPDNINQVLAVLTPIIVYLIPNKPAT